MHLPLEDFEIYEQLTEPHQYSFLALPIEFLRAVDNTVKSGEIEPLIISFYPKPFSEEWYTYEKVVRLMTWIKMVCEKENIGMQLRDNITLLLDEMAHRTPHYSLN